MRRHWPTALVVTTQALDIVSTRAALRAGGYEANPFMRPFADSWVQMLGVKSLATLPFVYLALRWPGEARTVALVLSAIYAVIIYGNFSIALGGAS